MLVRRAQIKLIGVTALLLAALACRAATQLVVPNTPTPTPSQTATVTPTFTPTATQTPSLTPTVIFEAACPTLVAGILNDITSDVGLPGERGDERFRGEGSVFLVSYDVREDKLGDPQIQSVPDPLEDERDDRATHEAIWNYFAAVIPPQARARVSEFSIFTDGRGSHLAAVSPSFGDPERWTLHVDIVDADSYYDLTYTLIHEQGHLLTLNSEQVPLSEAILRYPENSTVHKQEVSACPQYFTGEGCSQPDSYINQFFSRFWPFLYAEWEQIDLEEDEETRQRLLEEFYENFRDQFLTDYAATSPEEDIAEAWTFFVLSPKPDLTSIANEKILFFYEYPELVELRTQILTQICEEFPR
jgi:hypothetical protein